jgi:hypothetical protein
MRQQPQQNNSKIFWLAFGILSFGLTYFFMGGSDAPAAKTPKKLVKNSSVSGSADDQILPEDYKVKFEKVPAPPHDVFQPVIYHQATIGGAGSSLINAIPPEYASGEADWVFTGTAEINSVPEANFENGKAGQFVQVERGEHWKSSVVSQIGPDYVLLVGPNDRKKIPMPNDVVSAAPAAPAAAPAGVPPVNPFAGPIGADTNTTTDDAAAAALQQNLNMGGGGGRRRGGRGGGGRRGGGGGGGGGGFGGGG